MGIFIDAPYIKYQTMLCGVCETEYMLNFISGSQSDASYVNTPLSSLLLFLQFVLFRYISIYLCLSPNLSLLLSFCHFWLTSSHSICITPVESSVCSTWLKDTPQYAARILIDKNLQPQKCDGKTFPLCANTRPCSPVHALLQFQLNRVYILKSLHPAIRQSDARAHTHPASMCPCVMCFRVFVSISIMIHLFSSIHTN